MNHPMVSVIIPTRGKMAMLKQAVQSLLASHDPADLDIVIIEQGGEDAKKLIEEKFPGAPVRWMAAEDSWGFSEINNAAAATCQSQYLLLLNNDIICRSGFLAKMIEAMKSHPDVGIVGAKLLHLDGSIQHIGVTFRSDGLPQHLGYNRKDDGTFEPANRSDYYEAVTFACALIDKALWDEIGGLDPAYFFNYEDTDFCLKARERGKRCYVASDAVIIHLEGKSDGARKTEKHSVWRNLKILRDRWLYSGKFEALTGMKINKLAGTMRDDRLNIAFMPSCRSAGVPWWRMELPGRKLAKLGLANVMTLYADQNADELMRYLDQADIAYLQGFTSDWVLRIAQLKNRRPFKVVYDYDDHPLHISPFANAYRWFGTKEIQANDATLGKYWLWRDGENGFDIKRNVENRQRQHEIFSAVDMMTTTTPHLYAYFERHNSNVRMLPNCIDFDIYEPRDDVWHRTDGPVRIGWHGGDNHYHDMMTIGPWLTEFVNSHDVRLVMFGAYYRGPLKGIDPNKVIEEGWVHVEAFPYKLRAVGIDVALIPLADPVKPLMGLDMRFNAAKSNIKFLEHSAMKSPSLVQAGREAYACCSDGENCLTYDSKEEFIEKLATLCSDAKLRETIGTHAYEYTRAYYDLEKNAHRWVDAFQWLHDKPDEPVVDAEAASLIEAAESIPESDLAPATSNAASEATA